MYSILSGLWFRPFNSNAYARTQSKPSGQRVGFSLKALVISRQNTYFVQKNLELSQPQVKITIVSVHIIHETHLRHTSIATFLVKKTQTQDSGTLKRTWNLYQAIPLACSNFPKERL